MQKNLENNVLELLQNDARLSAKEIAATLGAAEREVSACIARLESTGAIVKYTAIVNGEKTEKTLHGIVYTLLARPGCAISAWLAMLAVVINKRWAYAFASLIGLLCGTAFFAAPGAGFDRQLVQFEEVFSMVEHVGFYLMALCFVTYRLAEFRFADMGKIGICFAVLAVYVFALIKGGIEHDPFLFLPNSDVHQLVGGLKYPVFLTLYIVFAHLFFGAFFVIDDRKAVKQFFNKLFKKA